MNTTAPVIALDHPAALDVARVGRKAANLAAARAAGLPVAPGVVLTTDWDTSDEATAALVWRITSHDGARPLVVRTSATGREQARPTERELLEDATIVTDLASMLVAVGARRVGEDRMPILLQPHIAGAWRGALFADGAARSWHAAPLAIARAAGATDEEGWIAVLDRTGRVRDVVSAQPAGGPPAGVLARLARLGERVAAAFGGPHDIEWLADADGRLHVLRVRPLVRLRSTSSAATMSTTPARGSGRSRRRRLAHHEPALASSPVDESAA